MIKVAENQKDQAERNIEPEMHEESFIHFANPNDQTLDRLVRAVEKAYNKPGQLMWRGFLYGFMTAVGATIGTAVIISLSAYVFNILGGVKYITNNISSFADQVTSKAVNDSNLLNK